MTEITHAEKETDLSDTLTTMCIDTHKSVFSDGDIIENAFIRVDAEGQTSTMVRVRWINGKVDVSIHRGDAMQEITVFHRTDQWVQKKMDSGKKWTNLKVID